MALPSLSVIIPNYNHGHHLPECLDSVLSQSVPPNEVLLIDDGSTDDSVAVMERLARAHPLVRVVRNEKNSGVLITVNRGIDLAQGDYFLPLAADDRPLPGLFAKTLTLLSRHPQAAFCGGITQFNDIVTGLQYYYGTHVSDHPVYLPPEEMVRLARRGRMLIFTTPILLRRSAVIEAGHYLPQLRSCSDWFTAWIVGYRYGVCYLPEVLGRFEKNPKGYSAASTRTTKDRLEIYRQILDHLALPQYQDSTERIRQASALAHFGKEMLWLVAKCPPYRRFLTSNFLRQCLWWSLRIEAKKVLPAPAVRLYFHLAGYAHPTHRPADAR